MRFTIRDIVTIAVALASSSWLVMRARAVQEGGVASSRLAAAAEAARGVDLAGAPGATAGAPAVALATPAAAAARGAGAGPAGGEAVAPAGPAAPGVADRALAAAGPWRAERVDVHWSLEQAKVVSPGKTVAVPADPETGQPGGLYTDGYVLEGKVRAKRGGILPEGDFRLELTAFRPDADLPGQKAGLWHVQGRWKVVARDADPAALRARHNPYVVEGRIQDALRVNPAEDGGAWSARASVPTSPAAGRWARGQRGTLTLRPGGGGDLEIALALLGGNR